MTSSLPLRDPDATDPRFMTRRAWWLIIANLLIPGAGPLLGGARRIGRFALAVWLLGWVALAALVVVWFTARGALLFALTTWWGLAVVSVAVFAIAVLWSTTMVVTLVQVRLIRVDAFARGLILLLAILLAIAPPFGAALAAGRINVAQGALNTLFGGPNAGLALPSDGRLNIMLLGGDRGADRDGMRFDSVSVMSFDAWTGQLTTIGIPRTTQNVPFAAGPMHDMYPDGYRDCDVDVCYLNSIYTEVTVRDYDIYPDAAAHGSDKGIEATRDAVEGALGLDIPYYVMVDMAGFAELIDAMGGVSMNVTERVAMGINDDGSPGWEPPSAWIEPGQQVLNGDHALWYARSRYDTTDYARMDRQRQLQDAVIAQLPAKLLADPAPVLDAISKVITTDIPKGEVGVIADLALKSRGRTDNVRLDLVPPRIDPEDPDFAEARRLVELALTNELPAVPTT